MMIVPLAIPLP